MKILKAIWAYIKKHYRWLAPVVIFFAWVIVREKTFMDIFSFLAGVIFMCFVWYAWSHFVNKKADENKG
jgi:amino acid permease